MTRLQPIRIIGHMVVRNEMGRYLEPCLTAALEYCDVVHVYDDLSDDGTLDWLRAWAPGRRLLVDWRLFEMPSFAEDESAFRQEAWLSMTKETRARPNDWVMCLDADEFVVTKNPAAMTDIRGQLEDEINRARVRQRTSIAFDVPEVFDTRDGELSIRTDGYWGKIKATRLVRYDGLSEFHPRVEGGGSIPSRPKQRDWNAGNVVLLHMGYARPEDRQAKHARYSEGKGHNSAHVASIVTKPRLQKWTGAVPSWM